MCGRFTLLTYDEVLEVADAIAARSGMRFERASGRHAAGAAVPHELGGDGHTAPARAQARPASIAPVLAASSAASPRTAPQLAVTDMTWGIEAPWNGKLVINARIESALGGSAMWAGPIRDGRCIVPAATFFEPHATETTLNPRTRKPMKRPYEFAMEDGSPLLLAGVHDGARFSIVTTEPNEFVSPIHPRMPLALRFEEVPLWFEGDFEPLVSRSGLQLAVEPEQLGGPGKDTETEPGQLSLF